MGEVLNLESITCIDLPTSGLLDGAIGKFSGGMIIDSDKDGVEYFASSIADGPDAVLKIGDAST